MKRRFASYLRQLSFDPGLLRSPLARFLNNPRLVLLLITLIILIGYSSLTAIPRVLNPNIQIPIVIISTPLPGAGPNDIESLVTIPIENSVSGLDSVKTVTSSSEDSVSVVQVEFNSGVDPNKARTDVQSAVDSVTLPTDAQTPKVQKIDFQNVPVWNFIVTGNQDTASLNNFAKTLQDNLKNNSSIASVTTSGLNDEEIQILINPSAVTTYHINPLQLTQLITASVKSFPAGSVKTDMSTFALTIDPAVTTVADVRNLTISYNGTAIPLSDIAEVSLKAKPDEAQSFFADQNHTVRKGISFSVFKTNSVSVDKAVTDSEKVINDTLSTYPNQFHVNTVVNTGSQIDKQFNDLIRDFTTTIILVFITLFIFLGLRQALVALLSTPLTFFITFTVMRLTDIPLSFIAIFSLLLSLGLLVDDTIVVISAMTAYYRTGKFTPLQTGLLVWRDFFFAIFTTTITTVWAFLPLLLASGIIGEFIKAIPIVVSSSLLASFFVAMLITLPVLVVLLRFELPRRVVVLLKVMLVVFLISLLLIILPKGKLFPLEILAIVIFLFVTQTVRRVLLRRAGTYFHKEKRSNQTTFVNPIRPYVNDGIIHFERIAERYRKIMRGILDSSSARRQVVIMVILFSIFSFLLLPLGFVKNEFFPNSDQDYIYMSLEMPSGTNLDVTTNESTRLLNDLRKTPNVAFVTADVAQGVSQGFGSSSGGTNLATFSLVLQSTKIRHISSIDIAQSLRNKYASYNKGTLQVVEESNGPPAGADVQIKLFGSDLTKLDHYATSVENFLKKQPGLTNVDKSIKPGTSKLVFVPDKIKMAQYNLTPDTVGLWLRLFASGMKASSIKLTSEDNNDHDITIRMSPSMSYADAVNSIMIPIQTASTTQPTSVPLASLGTTTLAPNPTLITREGGKRTISVSASITKGALATEENKKLEDFANNGLHLDSGYSWQTGGVNEENQNSVTSILQAMLLSFLLIIITMVIQFSSFRKALIVMLVIPLSISGVFVLFAITRTPLSFPALIGVLALFGIVVKNSILIVDKINQNKKVGMEFVDSIIDGASSRLEAIALTTFATIIGLIPITLSDPLWRGLGGAIIAGLSFSGTIMLFFIPVVYYYWFRSEEIR